MVFLAKQEIFIQNKNFLTLRKFDFERRYFINTEGVGNGRAGNRLTAVWIVILL